MKTLKPYLLTFSCLGASLLLTGLLYFLFATPWTAYKLIQVVGASIVVMTILSMAYAVLRAFPGVTVGFLSMAALVSYLAVQYPSWSAFYDHVEALPWTPYFLMPVALLIFALCQHPGAIGIYRQMLKAIMVSSSLFLCGFALACYISNFTLVPVSNLVLGFSLMMLGFSLSGYMAAKAKSDAAIQGAALVCVLLFKVVSIGSLINFFYHLPSKMDEPIEKVALKYQDKLLSLGVYAVYSSEKSSFGPFINSSDDKESMTHYRTKRSQYTDSTGLIPLDKSINCPQDLRYVECGMEKNGFQKLTLRVVKGKLYIEGLQYEQEDVEKVADQLDLFMEKLVIPRMQIMRDTFL